MRERRKHPINEQIAERFHNADPEMQAAVLKILKLKEKSRIKNGAAASQVAAPKSKRSRTTLTCAFQ